jgi:flavin-dependent dehydrogenase
MNNHHFDVLVIGGGPAGTTAASFLIEKGWSVCLLEKAHHPRFHIGESLLPMNLPILKRLGVLDAVHSMGMKKNAAEFNSTATALAKDTFYFAKAIDKTHPYAYQVRRAEFDQILFENCVTRGVHALQGVRVIDVDLEQDKLKTVHAISDTADQLAFTCRYIIDASGRDTFLANKLKCKQKNPRHQMAAIYAHYTKVQRRTGADSGNISIYWFKHGWIWLIPLQNGVMSVGIVCWPGYLKTRNTSLQEFLSHTLHMLPELSKRMQGAELLGEVHATGNYSYASSQMIGKGYLLVGDAYAFVDPVFSSGVFLAMQGAADGAELVDKLLNEADNAKRLIHTYQRKVKRGIDAISWFIYRFNTPTLHRLLMSSDDKKQNKLQMKLKSSVISILSGDIYGNANVTMPLLMFKTLYFFLSLKNFGETVRFLRFKAKQW